MGRGKVVYYGETLMDLTGDTVTPESLLVGATAHNKAGDKIDGACTYDSDTSEDTASPGDMLDGVTAHARGVLITGNIPRNGAVAGSISKKDDSYTIAYGLHDGSGTVGIDPVEKAKLVPENIRQNVTILGIKGSMDPTEGESAEASKTVSPGKTDQTYSPDNGYTCFRQFTVKGIPFTEVANSAGGTTVTIG